MILLILGIIIACFVLSMIFYESDWADYVSMISSFLFVLCVISAIVLGIQVKNLSVIDDRIAMYEEENAKIEQQISDVVKQYQKYESDIFTEVNPESSIQYVSLYPELKSNTLVQSQIEIYCKNNSLIRILKDDLIRGSVKRWWLYFGGNN